MVFFSSGDVAARTVGTRHWASSESRSSHSSLLDGVLKGVRGVGIGKSGELGDSVVDWLEHVEQLTGLWRW